MSSSHFKPALVPQKIDKSKIEYDGGSKLKELIEHINDEKRSLKKVKVSHMDFNPKKSSRGTGSLFNGVLKNKHR